MPAKPTKFSDADRALIAGWLHEVSFYGYGAAIGATDDEDEDDDGHEWLGITPPGMARNGDLWHIALAPGGGYEITSSVDGRTHFLVSDLRAALGFAAPLPPGCPDPQPMPGELIPSAGY